MKKTFKMQGLDCANCAAKMEAGINKIDGVTVASISFMTQKLSLDVVDDRFEEVKEEIIRICKKVEPDCRIFF